MCKHLNELLHGKNWKRQGVIGVQGVAAIERHKSWNPHVHSLLGHPDLNLASPEFRPVMREMRHWCGEQWGFSDWQIVKATADCRSYVIDYAAKTGELYVTDKLEFMLNGQNTLPC